MHGGRLGSSYPEFEVIWQTSLQHTVILRKYPPRPTHTLFTSHQCQSFTFAPEKDILKLLKGRFALDLVRTIFAFVIDQCEWTLKVKHTCIQVWRHFKGKTCFCIVVWGIPKGLLTLADYESERKTILFLEDIKYSFSWHWIGWEPFVSNIAFTFVIVQCAWTLRV